VCYDSLSQAYSECSKRTKHHGMDLISSHSTFSNLVYPENLFHDNMQSVQGRKVNILGGYSIGHYKQISVYVCACVVFQTVSEIELFHCTVPELFIRKRYYILFLIPVFIVQVTKFVHFT
jgi:hypothetical protein